MTLRLRQIALVAADLAAVERQVADTLDVELCFRDPGVGEFGLHNALFPIGDTFLEIVSPTTGGTTAGRLLDKRGGDGGYMVLLQTDELDPVRARLDQLGVRIVYVAKGERIEGLHLHPRDVGGAIVSIDRSEDPADWEWAGPAWREHVRTGTVSSIDAVEVQVDDPAATAARWGRVLDREPAPGGTTIALDQGSIRFVAATDGRGEGVGGVDVVATDRSRAGTVTDIGGARFRFV